MPVFFLLYFVFYVCKILWRTYRSFISFLFVPIFQTPVDIEDISMEELNATEYTTTPTVRTVILTLGMGLTNQGNKN